MKTFLKIMADTMTYAMAVATTRTMKLAILAAVPTLTLLVTMPALADLPTHYDCTEMIEGKKVEAISTNNQGKYDVKLSIDGQDIPVFGGRCFESNRPGNRFLLCGFRSDDFRIDLYPWTQTTSGAIKPMQYVVWHGDVPSTPAAFTNCTN